MKDLKKSLTVAELKLLILANHTAREARDQDLQKRLAKALGDEEQPENKALTQQIKQFKSLVCDITAGRLKLSPRATPLISYQDIEWVLPVIIETVFQSDGVDITELGNNEWIEPLTKNILEYSLKLLSDTTLLTTRNHYDSYWLWIETVFKLATKHSISPLKYLDLPEASDEIQRTIYTKEQTIELNKQLAAKYLNAERMKNMLLEPLTTFLADGNEEERQDARAYLEETLLSLLNARIEKSREILDAVSAEEIARIYGDR